MPYEEKKKPTNAARNPLVSVITPLYNSEQFIEETIRSVQAQTYTHWEHIIVNDASTDGSAGIVSKLADEDPRIRFVDLTENKGAAFCRNRATELATGDLIAFLDSDDLWAPEKLERQLQFMEEHGLDVSYTSYVHMDESGKDLGKRIVALPVLAYEKQLRNNYVGNLTGMYRAATLGKVLAPNIRKRQDWAVWLEAISRSGKPAMGLDEDLSRYRVRKGSISANKWNLVKYNFKFYRDHLGYSWFKSVYWLSRFFAEYFFVRPKLIKKG